MERLIEALKRMEAEHYEAKLRQEDELRQEDDLWQEAELRRPKAETIEEGERSGTDALEEEESEEKDNMEDGNEGETTSVE